jgi:pimeloyl-ACP methyl ester carboxylesterase
MSKSTPSKSNASRSTKQEQTAGKSRGRPQMVSARWIGIAFGSVVAVAVLCVWGALCYAFWQGSWQLLYRPETGITHTPAEVGVAFNNISFDAIEAGVPQLQGWWIPAAARAGCTVLYFHGATGNISDTVAGLARLHRAGLAVFTFDFRGYGQSQFAHPSEAHWREDAESALHYLTDTRHISARTLIVAGRGLGADLALEVAAAHPELAGVIVEDPFLDPTSTIFEDPRARLVPAHWLVKERWDMKTAAATLRVPSLWFCSSALCGSMKTIEEPASFKVAQDSKTIVWLTVPEHAQKDYAEAMSRWIDDLASTR